LIKLGAGEIDLSEDLASGYRSWLKRRKETYHSEGLDTNVIAR